MAKKPGPKILRVGLIQNQRILEERLFRKPQTVTVGQDFKKNTLVVPASNLPKTFPVFALTNKGYVLQFTEKMEGKISGGQGVKTLEEVRKKGIAKKKGKLYQLPLNPKMRGRVAIGEATVLFQFVTPPPVRSRPVLPASMRGGILGGGIDRPLAVAVALAAILQVGFVLYLEFAVEIPEGERYRWVHDDVHAEVDLEDDEDDPPEQDDDEGEDEVEPEEEEPEPQPAEPDPEPDPEDQADQEFEQELDATDQADDYRTESVIGAIDEMGGVANIVDSAVAEIDTDSMLGDADGIRPGDISGPGPLGRPDGSDEGGRVEGSDLDIEEGEGPGGVEGPEDAPIATVEATEPAPTPAVPNPGDFMGPIRGRDGQVEACYQAELTTNREARGEVLIELTVDQDRRGNWRVSNARAIQDSVGGGVGTCIANALNGLRMPEPDSGETVVLEMPYTFAPR